MSTMRGAFVLAIVASAATAHANVELDLLGGGHRFSKTNPFGVDSSSTESEKDAPLAGLRLGLYFADRIGLEGEAIGIPTKASSDSSSITDLSYRGHLLLEFRAGSADNAFIPFLLVGGGILQVYKTSAL